MLPFNKFNSLLVLELVLGLSSYKTTLHKFNPFKSYKSKGQFWMKPVASIILFFSKGSRNQKGKYPTKLTNPGTTCQHFVKIQPFLQKQIKRCNVQIMFHCTYQRITIHQLISYVGIFFTSSSASLSNMTSKENRVCRRKKRLSQKLIPHASRLDHIYLHLFLPRQKEEMGLSYYFKKNNQRLL